MKKVLRSEILKFNSSKAKDKLNWSASFDNREAIREIP